MEGLETYGNQTGSIDRDVRRERRRCNHEMQIGRWSGGAWMLRPRGKRCLEGGGAVALDGRWNGAASLSGIASRNRAAREVDKEAAPGRSRWGGPTRRCNEYSHNFE